MAALDNHLLQAVKVPLKKNGHGLDPITDDLATPGFRKVDRGIKHVLTSTISKKIVVTGKDKWLKQYEQWPQEQFAKIDWRKAPA